MGRPYYKRPSNYEVVFDKVPPLAMVRIRCFAYVGDPASWEKRFVVTYEGEREFSGRRTRAAAYPAGARDDRSRDGPRRPQRLGDWTRIRYDYYNGGHITMTQTFREVGAAFMLAEQNAEIAIPYAKAVAHGTYTDYKTNVAVDDSIFTKKK